MNLPTTNPDKRSFWQRRQFHDERDFILSTGPVALVTGAQHSFRDAMLARLRRLLGERVPLRKLVDVGCAIGDWTIAYAGNGFAEEVVGVDLNAGFLAAARVSAGRVGLAAPRLRFVEGDACATGEVAGADLVCMGAVLQYLSAAEATALLGRLAQAQRPGDLLYIRTSCSPRRSDEYYRRRDWYEALFARLGYRILDTEISAAIAVQSHAAFLGPLARVFGRVAAWVHRRVVSRNRLEFVNWVLERGH